MQWQGSSTLQAACPPSAGRIEVLPNPNAPPRQRLQKPGAPCLTMISPPEALPCPPLALPKNPTEHIDGQRCGLGPSALRANLWEIRSTPGLASYRSGAREKHGIEYFVRCEARRPRIEPSSGCLGGFGLPHSGQSRAFQKGLAAVRPPGSQG